MPPSPAYRWNYGSVEDDNGGGEGDKDTFGVERMTCSGTTEGVVLKDIP